MTGDYKLQWGFQYGQHVYDEPLEALAQNKAALDICYVKSIPYTLQPHEFCPRRAVRNVCCEAALSVLEYFPGRLVTETRSAYIHFRKSGSFLPRLTHSERREIVAFESRQSLQAPTAPALEAMRNFETLVTKCRNMRNGEAQLARKILIYAARAHALARVHASLEHDLQVLIEETQRCLRAALIVQALSSLRYPVGRNANKRIEWARSQAYDLPPKPMNIVLAYLYERDYYGQHGFGTKNDPKELDIASVMWDYFVQHFS